MKISLCLIIRDEIGNLGQLVESCRSHVDEVCILDTGSKDGSAELGKKLADKWSHTNACNDSEGRIADFSAARNLNLAMASHECVLWLDGDDRIEGAEHLRKLASEAPRATTGQAWAFLAEYEYDQDAQGRPITVQWRERLVAPASAFEWRGPVHEGLLGKAGTNVTHLPTDAFRVVHRRRKLNKRPDPERNLRILRAWFKAHGEADARLMHYFGSELLLNRHIGEARYWLRRHVHRSPWSDERALSLLHLAKVELAFEDHEEAARWALQATATKSWPEPWWVLGQAYIGLAEQGIDAEYNTRRGLNALERGFMLDGDPKARSLLMVDPMARYEAHEWFAPALAKCGRLDDAIKSAELGLAGKPDSASLKQNLDEWRRVKLMQGAEALGLEPQALAIVAAALAGRATLEKPQAVAALPARKLEPLPNGKLRIAFWLGHQLESWTPETLERDGMGGSETMAWELSKRLAKLGHRVTVFGHCDPALPGTSAFDHSKFPQVKYEGVQWCDASLFGNSGFFDDNAYDVLIVSRQAPAVTIPHSAIARVLWVHDVHVGPDFTPQIAQKYDFVWCLSEWHKRFFCEVYPWLPPSKVEVTRNGIDPSRFTGLGDSDGSPRRNPHRAIYSSSPDRGLAAAVESWPSVRAAVPDAELHCFYGFENWERSIELGGENGLPQCSKAALVALKKACAETEGVFMRGKVNQRELAKEMLSAGVWFYPTWFSETSCITAMEAQAAGLWCVCPDIAALKETVVARQRTWLVNPADAVIAKMSYQLRPAPDLLPDFSLDTLAEAWQTRLTNLVETQRANVVPAFHELAAE